jgi:hypothetical protein
LKFDLEFQHGILSLGCRRHLLTICAGYCGGFEVHNGRGLPGSIRPSCEAVLYQTLRTLFECHNARKPECELDLATLDPDMKASTSGVCWAMLVQKLTLGEMPPKDKPLPDAERLESVT